MIMMVLECKNSNVEGRFERIIMGDGRGKTYERLYIPSTVARPDMERRPRLIGVVNLFRVRPFDAPPPSLLGQICSLRTKARAGGMRDLCFYAPSALVGWQRAVRTRQRDAIRREHKALL